MQLHQICNIAFVEYDHKLKCCRLPIPNVTSKGASSISTFKLCLNCNYSTNINVGKIVNYMVAQLTSNISFITRITDCICNTTIHILTKHNK